MLPKSSLDYGAKWAYNTIPLKLFIDISEGGDLSLLGGSPRQNEIAWENIVAQNEKANGSFRFLNYRNSFAKLNLLRADYILVKSALTRLSFRVDNDDIEFLRKKGHKINTANADAYQQSLLVAMRVSDNLLTRIAMSQNEIERVTSKDTGGNSFAEVLAALSLQVGFNVPEDVKLAWFNAAKKDLIAKQQRHGGRK